MHKLPAESIDLIVTSPPYNLRNTSGGGLNSSGGSNFWKYCELINGYETHDDCMPHEKYVEWQRSCLTAMMRLVKENGAIFYNHKWRVQNGLIQDRADIVNGFPVRQIIIWERGGGMNFNPGYFLPNYEVIYLICKPEFRLSAKANGLGCVWRIPHESNNPHPAPFPVELPRRCIQSTEAQIVLDPFMGSGTTAIAARKCNRDWIGFEQSKAYCEMAHARLELPQQDDLFD